jgi:hypothetical protein
LRNDVDQVANGIDQLAQKGIGDIEGGGNRGTSGGLRFGAAEGGQKNGRIKRSGGVTHAQVKHLRFAGDTRPGLIVRVAKVITVVLQYLAQRVQEGNRHLNCD